MLHFASPCRTLVTAAIAGAILVPCGLMTLAFHARVQTRYPFVAVPEMLPAVNLNEDNGNEMKEVSLQETLDRLGYTVNVPAVYGGHTLLRWTNYRLSTGDDSLSATSFHSLKMPRFTKVSEQAMLGGSLEFGVTDERGVKEAILAPDHNRTTFWISATEGASCAWRVADSLRFYLNDTENILHTGALSSVPQANADHAPHLLALPARKGGTWVKEGNNTGHWQGGADTGAVLLCWEDWRDFDYQDMVILAEDVQPDKN